MKNAAPRVSIVQIVRVNAQRGFVRFGHVVDERLVVDFSMAASIVATSGSARPAGRRRRSASSRHTTPRSCHAPQLAHDKPHRHRVQHFVADHHAFEALRQRIEPSHLRSECGRVGFDRLALALAQFARQIDDRIAVERHVQIASSAFSKPAASLPVPAPNSITSRVPLACSACATGRASVAANSGDSSGAVTKSLPSSAAQAEFHRAAAVIAEAGRVKRAVPYSGRTAASRPPLAIFVADQRDQRFGLRERVGAGSR